MSIYENVAYGPKIHGIKDKHTLDMIVEKSLKQAALWDEVKDNLRKEGFKTFWRDSNRDYVLPGLLPVRTGEIFFGDGRAYFSLRPYFDHENRRPNPKLKKDYTIILVTHNMQPGYPDVPGCLFKRGILVNMI